MEGASFPALQLLNNPHALHTNKSLNFTAFKYYYIHFYKPTCNTLVPAHAPGINPLEMFTKRSELTAVCANVHRVLTLNATMSQNKNVWLVDIQEEILECLLAVQTSLAARRSALDPGFLR